MGDREGLRLGKFGSGWQPNKPLMPEQSRSGAPMEWTTVQHLDLRHSGGRRGASARPMQPHAAAFRSSQAIVAVAIGTHVVGAFSLTTPLRLPSRCSLVGILG